MSYFSHNSPHPLPLVWPRGIHSKFWSLSPAGVAVSSPPLGMLPPPWAGGLSRNNKLSWLCLLSFGLPIAIPQMIVFVILNQQLGPKRRRRNRIVRIVVISSYRIPVWSRVWKTPPITWALRVGDAKGSEGVPCLLHELAPFISFL